MTLNYCNNLYLVHVMSSPQGLIIKLHQVRSEGEVLLGLSEVLVHSSGGLDPSEAPVAGR